MDERIKRLVWEKSDFRWGCIWNAGTVFGSYMISHNEETGAGEFYLVGGSRKMTKHASLEEAKSAAEFHWQARVAQVLTQGENK